MTKFEFKTTSNKIYKRDFRIRIIRLALLILLLFLILLYFILSVIYDTGIFTVILDENLSWEKGIVIYDKLSEKQLLEWYDGRDNILDNFEDVAATKANIPPILPVQIKVTQVID